MNLITKGWTNISCSQSGDILQDDKLYGNVSSLTILVSNEKKKNIGKNECI